MLYNLENSVHVGMWPGLYKKCVKSGKTQNTKMSNWGFTVHILITKVNATLFLMVFK
jgi:hypothetical protein